MPDQTIPDGVISVAHKMAPKSARCEPADFQRAIEMAYLAGCLDQQRIDRVETDGVRKLLDEAYVTIRAFVEPNAYIREFGFVRPADGAEHWPFNGTPITPIPDGCVRATRKVWYGKAEVVS